MAREGRRDIKMVCAHVERKKEKVFPVVQAVTSTSYH